MEWNKEKREKHIEFSKNVKIVSTTIPQTANLKTKTSFSLFYTKTESLATPH